MMSLDAKIAESIREAVAEAGQSKTLARQLIAWMTAVASGNEDPSDGASASRHLELLYNETVILPGGGTEDL
jgi:hypothetical protein